MKNIIKVILIFLLILALLSLANNLFNLTNGDSSTPSKEVEYIILNIENLIF